MAKSRRSSERHRPEAESRSANVELVRARKAIEALRAFYVTNTAFGAILLVLALLAGLGALALGVLAALTAVAAVGAARIRREPFVWSLVLAVLWTALVLLQVLAGTAGTGCTFVFTCVWALACWFGVRATRRASQLMDQYPDLRVTRRMRGR